MRLLFLTENYPPDRRGMGESCDRIVRGLTRAGVEVELVRFDRKTDDAAHTINLTWNRVQHEVDLERITHVVAFGGYLPLLAAPAFAAWISRPLLTLLRGNEFDAGLFDPRRRPILDDALRRSAAVCTVTQTQAEKVTALYPEIRPHVVPNGIDFTLWQPTAGDAARGAAWRAQHIHPTRRLAGMFGHLKSKKGAAFFVDSLLRSGLEDRFHLLLIGEMAPTLTAQYTHITTIDRYELIPFYLACDLIVLPSHYDGFPNVLIEAMALGKPILASRVGGMRDVLTDGENAFLFAPGNEHSCRDAIARAAAATDEQLQRMGASAAALARRQCDARDETRRYVEVLEEIDANRDLDRRPDAPARQLSWRGR